MPRITSPYAANLIYLDDFSKYIKAYDQRRYDDPSLRDCPLDHPFYD